MKKWWPYVAVAVAAVLLAVFEADLLYTAQDNSLFLHTPLFFEQQMVRSGGLLTWVGCYLTQFFYYPMLGAGLLGLLWAFLLWLIKRTFRLRDASPGLVPVACLLMTIITVVSWLALLTCTEPIFRLFGANDEVIKQSVTH